MRRLGPGTVLLAAAVLMSSAACSSNSGSGGQTASGNGPSEQHPVNITIAAVTTDSCSQGWIAQEEGMFKKQGLNVTVKFVAGVPELSAAVASGAAQFACTAPISVIDGVNGGLGFTMVAPGISNTGTNGEHLGYAFWVRNSSGINSYKDLAGKTVAMNALNSFPYYALRAQLQKAGVPVSEVKLVKLNFPQIPGAVVSGAVDGGIATSPYISPDLYHGEAHNLGDPAAIVNGGNTMGTVWFAKDSYVKDNPKTALAFANAIIGASKWANDTANDKERRALFIKYTKLAPDAVDSLTLGKFFDTMKDTSVIKPFITLTQEFGDTKKDLTVKDLVWSGAP